MRYVITSIMTETGYPSKSSLARTASELPGNGNSKKENVGEGASCQF
jgi:hypothetical protein